MTSRSPAVLRRRENERLHCDVPGCYSNRVHLGRYCSTHVISSRRLGHPEGRSVSRAELAPYRKTFERVLDENHGQPAVSAALDWMERLLSLGTDGTASPAHGELRRLRDAGVRGRAALIAVGAVWLYSSSHERELPSDSRLTFALSRHLALCAPQDKRFAGLGKDGKARHFYRSTPTTVLRDLGKVLRDTLGCFFMQVVEQLDREDRERLELANALRTPFTTPTPAAPPTLAGAGA